MTHCSYRKGYELTVAELPVALKNAHSHRAKALAALVDALRGLE